MKLNVKKTNKEAIQEVGKIYFLDDEDFVVSPNSSGLIRTGISIEQPKGYKLDIELLEDLNDSDLVLIGKVIAPKSMKEELGLVVYNFGKKSYRIESGTLVATYGLIKYTDIEFEKTEELDD